MPRINPDFSQERRNPSSGQSTFPDILLREAPVLHGRHGDCFSVAGKRRGRQHDHRCPHAQIIDPAWGSKLTGSAGKFTFGVLNASDASPDGKLYNIGRVTYG